jgi:hypothetical protein
MCSWRNLEYFYKLEKNVINNLNLSDGYKYHFLLKKLLLHSLARCVYGFHVVLKLKATISLKKSTNQLIFVMVKCCIPFEVRTEFLNNI